MRATLDFYPGANGSAYDVREMLCGSDWEPEALGLRPSPISPDRDGYTTCPGTDGNGWVETEVETTDGVIRWTCPTCSTEHEGDAE